MPPRDHQFKILDVQRHDWPRASHNPQPYRFNQRWKRRTWLDTRTIVAAVLGIVYGVAFVVLLFGVGFLVAFGIQKVLEWLG